MSDQTIKPGTCVHCGGAIHTDLMRGRVVHADTGLARCPAPDGGYIHHQPFADYA